MKKMITILLAAMSLIVFISGCSSDAGSKGASENAAEPSAADVKTAEDQRNTGETEDVGPADDNKNTGTPEDQKDASAADDLQVSADSDDTVKEVPNVYMTKNISREGLMAVYKALDRAAEGKVAIKLHMGEPGGHNFLAPDLVKDFVQSLDGTFVDCNTAYGGKRATTAMHMQAAKDHGFTEIAPVDIMDADGTVNLPVTNGKHLKEDVVGSHYENYDFFVILSHFKGHEMGGFGGAIKNMSIGIASVKGKNIIHTAGKSSTSMWGGIQDDFLESMAEAAKAVADSKGERILYINVMNNLSIDCDCNSYPAKPTMADIGILASLDPVALDKACVDLVYDAPDGQSLIKRMESKNGIHTLEYAEEIGLGSQKYNLVKLDD